MAFIFFSAKGLKETKTMTHASTSFDSTKPIILDYGNLGHVSDDDDGGGGRRSGCPGKSSCGLACASITLAISTIVLLGCISFSARILVANGILAKGDYGGRVDGPNGRYPLALIEKIEERIDSLTNELRSDGKVVVPSVVFGNVTMKMGAAGLARDAFQMHGSDAGCSVSCQCSRAGLAAYGRYCGFGYTACPGYPPCDELDACCAEHDMCVTLHGRMDCGCTIALHECAMCVALSGKRDPGSDWKCRDTEAAVSNVIADMEFLFPECLGLAGEPSLRQTKSHDHQTKGERRWGERSR
jgi:hypothetical protein